MDAAGTILIYSFSSRFYLESLLPMSTQYLQSICPSARIHEIRDRHPVRFGRLQILQARALEKIRPVCYLFTINHQLSTFNHLPLTVKIGVGLEVVSKPQIRFKGKAQADRESAAYMGM
jgi:hypothetical protein